MSAVISADDFLANGSDKLHDMLATHVDAATGRAMPQVEIRFKDLSFAADVVVATKDGANELPTLANEAKKFCMSLAQSKNVFHKDILHPVSGVFKPATMTLLLGQPGSGKSSLMKMLAGRFPADRNVTVNGSVTYNGVKSSEVKKKIPQLVSYISQRDYHFPQLTVQETMEFAHECCGGVIPQRVLDALVSGTPEENTRAKDIIEALYQDTIVGDAMTRGVSGGERKRVTIGEMEFGMKQVSLMDEISTGLDSAATFDIVKSQQSMAKSLKKTIVIALLQPSPEVFEPFDDVMIMNGGKTMGMAQLEQFGMPTGKEWIWYCLIYLIGSCWLFVVMSFASLQYIRYDHGHGIAVADEDAKNGNEADDGYVKLPPTPVGSPDSASVIVPVESFIPVTLAFKDLHYSVPNPTKGEPELELLKGVSGYALPGTVTALMGSSGAGKTTLMDVIAGRKTGGKIVGDILLNGYKATDLAIRRCTGYCEQMDIHCESATFREALIFSSMLRQSSDIPTATKFAHAEECIRVLEMYTIADSIIRGSSVEQMKHLTIGV
ncbi:hypothetical protein AC1031_018939 [Aphanomyces cochlioides]|nr:hypothetical protein AC1031_018939 [Aphanomyces cochlioides]